MSLSLYNKKRNFSDTTEPTGKEKKNKGILRFVVQKHDASSVHYDFRLEMEGVLKSWAVPKGPSLNPKDKRLAMMVEDHPYDYRNFEGIIPEGNYGAGTVIVWDEGTYEPAGQQDEKRDGQKKSLLQQLQAGNLKLILHGEKLRGEFSLVKMKNKGDKAWILIKKKDNYATENDITENDTSIQSGKTLAQVAKENGAELHHPSTTLKKAGPKKKETKNASPASDKKKVHNAIAILSKHSATVKKTSMPEEVEPMLSTLVDEPFDDKDWLFEIKWDGYRAVAYINNHNVEILSRNQTAFTQKYHPLTEALKTIGINAVLDGEIVAVDEKGLADFQLLQNWQNSPVHLQYFIFDILWLNGEDLTHLPLIERKKILFQILPEGDEIIKYSDHVSGEGKNFFKAATQQGLEGIMAKRASSIYVPGSRSDDWLKIKVTQRQEVIIAGFTAPRNTRKFFGALLLGVYNDEELVYVGHTGSGFNTKSLEVIWKKLQPLIIPYSPFQKTPKTNMPATWVQPELVCEIKFTAWTKDQQARHPIFMGLREDKNSKEVKMEKSKTTASKVKKQKSTNDNKKQPSKKASGNKGDAGKSKVLLDIAEGKDQTIVLDNQELKLTNLNKLYWKKEGFSKGDLINYYLQIAPYILPYIKDKPQSLNRFPNGINGTHFYQKDVRGKVADWIQKFEFFSESTGETIEYLVCRDEATLIYMANLGCIEIHPWHSRIQKIDCPDYSLIDLDPDNNSYEEVVETAQVIKRILEAAGVPSYPKTSGATGMHIHIPLGAKYNYDQAKQLAEIVVRSANKELPELTSLERNPQKRKKKIYLDYLQNNPTQTVAAPYSLRPKPGVPVSAPLHWDEVKKGLTAKTYTAYNIFERLKAEGDLFQPVLAKGIDLKKALQKIETLFS